LDEARKRRLNIRRIALGLYEKKKKKEKKEPDSDSIGSSG
jgi:hypothetical protein